MAEYCHNSCSKCQPFCRHRCPRHSAIALSMMVWLPFRRSWSCTTRASYQCSCMVRTAGRYLRWTHVRSFRHIMRMDDKADAKRILLASPPADWRRQLVSHFNFLFVSCGGLSWLPVSFLLHVKYTLSYRTVSSPHHLAQHRPTGSETLRSPKQQIWLRTALCWGWCRRMALRNRNELHARNDDD